MNLLIPTGPHFTVLFCLRLLSLCGRHLRASPIKLIVAMLMISGLTACATFEKLNAPSIFSRGDAQSQQSESPTAEEAGLSNNQNTYTITPLDQEHADQARAAQEDYTRALQRLNDGRTQEATVYLQSITARYPRLAGPWVNLGLINMRQNDFDTAATHLRKAISIHPNHAPAHNYLGVSLKELGQFDSARGSYRKALALDPNYADAHYNLAILLELYFREFKKALRHYEKFQSLSPSPDKKVAGWIKDLKRRSKK